MSRRYGRNQKRRARERIAQLEAAHTNDHEQLAYLSLRLSYAEDVIDHARSVLGNDVALPPVVRGDHPHPLGGDFVVPVPTVMQARYCDGAADAPATLEMKVTQMRQLLTDIEYAEQARAVHFYVMLDDGQAAYAIDEQAFLSLSREQLERTISGPISRALARHLAEFLKGR